MDITFRNPQADDSQWLWELNEESYRDVVIRLFGRWDKQIQKKMFREKWGIVRPAKVVLNGAERIGLVVLEEKEDYNWLQEIQIKKAYRGQGIGTRLMLDLIREAQVRNRPLRLQVLHENQAAKRFYERLGFREIERLENHFIMEIT